MRRAFLALLLAACTQGVSDDGSQMATGAPQVLQGQGEAGRYRFELVLDPPAPPLGARFSVETRVVDAATGAPAEVEVRLDADMPGHGHGMQTVPRHVRLEPGRWRSEGLRFHMPGAWRFEVRAGSGDAGDVLRLPFEQPAR